MIARQMPEEPARFVPIAERVVYFGLLILVIATPLILTTITAVAEIKWFLIAFVGPTLAVLWITSRVVTNRLQIRFDAIFVFGLLLIGVEALSMVWATNIWLSIIDLSRQIALFSVYFVVANAIIKDKDRDALLWAIALVGTVTSLYGIAQYYGYDFYPWAEFSEVPVIRGVSFFGHATFAASYLIMAIPLTLALAVTRSTFFSGMVAFIPVLIMLYHISFSGARAASVSLFLTGLVVVSFYLFRGRRGLHRGAIALAVIIVLIGAFFAYRAWDVKGSDLFGTRQASIAQRLYAWETASRIFLEHPVAGIGAGNYEVVSPAYWNTVEANRFANYERMFIQVHNEYLEIAVELGFVGIVIFLGLISIALVSAYTLVRNDPKPKNRRIGLGLFAAVLAALGDAVFTFNLQYPSSAFLFWTVLGMLSYSLSRIPEPDEASGEPADQDA